MGAVFGISDYALPGVQVVKSGKWGVAVGNGILSRPLKTAQNLTKNCIPGTHTNLRIGTERYWHKMYDYVVCFSANGYLS